MSTTSFPLSNIVPISVEVSPVGSPGLTFNQALIVGSTPVIPTVGSNSRLRLYTSVQAMLTDGFSTTDPEYNAATLYFGQSPAPTYLWVGRQNLTALGTVAVGSSGGAGYVIGDILTVVQSGASGGELKVAAVGTLLVATTTGTASSGSTALTVLSGTGIVIGQQVAGTGIAPNTLVTNVAGTAVTLSLPTTAPLSSTSVTFTNLGVVTAVSLVSGNQGNNYSVATDLATTGGTGTGALITINTAGETPLQAVAACRSANPAWYACSFVATATDSDYLALSAFIEAATPHSLFFVTSGETAILNNAPNNLFAEMKAQAFQRTFPVYSTTQSGTAPNNVYAACAAMGIAMGRNTGAPGSYFDLMFKPVAGVAYEPLSQTQLNSISGTVNRSLVGLNANVYLNYANGAYAFFQSATMSDGTFFDEVLNLDMLQSDMQTSAANLLTSVNALPITNQGVNQMAAVLAGACARSQQIGFIAPAGIWNGVSIGVGNGAINPGDSLPNGFKVYAPPVSTLSQAQRSTRQLPPMTVALIAAQSAHSLVVTIQVQQ